MVKNLKHGGEKGSVTRSTASLNRKLATSSGPRTLTRPEIELLRQSKREIAERYKSKTKQ
jgi:hypothetical protein